MRVAISNQTIESINEDRLRMIAERVLSGERSDKAEISVALIEASEMRGINNRYRNKDEVTDVLSFPHNGVGLEGTKINFIGEVLICPSKVRDQAEEDELERVLIHGVLHLLGYDHELSKKEEMRMREKENFYFQLL